MTSNQLTYWRQEQDKIRDEETKRANLARERETNRHNLTQEEIDQARNALESRGLDIKDKEQLLKIWEIYSKYGTTDALQIPPEYRDVLFNTFGIDVNSYDADSLISDIWHEIKDVMGGLGSILKGAGGLF